MNVKYKINPTLSGGKVFYALIRYSFSRWSINQNIIDYFEKREDAENKMKEMEILNDTK